MIKLRVPRLLVSVRDADEARSALRGGADIIDVKDPENGSLGRPDATKLKELCKSLSVSAGNASQPAPPLSVALGELTDAHGDEEFAIPRQVAYAKVGLSGTRDVDSWRLRWIEMHRRYERRHGRRLQWVAVAYADRHLARSPSLSSIIHAAIESSCAGILIDTYEKSRGRLLDHMTAVRLTQAAESVQQHGLFFAVAGRLRLDDLTELVPIRPDIIAVRSAACEHGDRRARVTETGVRQVRRSIDDAFRDSPWSCTDLKT